jgi:hypothetical protein
MHGVTLCYIACFRQYQQHLQEVFPKQYTVSGKTTGFTRRKKQGASKS